MIIDTISYYMFNSDELKRRMFILVYPECEKDKILYDEF